MKLRIAITETPIADDIRTFKLHRRSAGRRPPRPTDKRRQYRAGRESKAYALPMAAKKGGRA